MKTVTMTEWKTWTLLHQATPRCGVIKQDLNGRFWERKSLTLSFFAEDQVSVVPCVEERKSQLTVTRAIPEMVKARGIGAIRDWCATDRPDIQVFGLSYFGLKEKAGRLNVAGFWIKRRRNGLYRFRPLKTMRPGFHNERNKYEQAV